MTNTLTRIGIAAVGLAAAVAGVIAVAGPGSAGDGGDCNAPLPRGSEPVNLDPADFTTQIDNPYWPMSPGTRWVYRETDPDANEQKVVVTVTTRTKKVAAGVTTRVIHDVVTERGQPVEITDDYYAQDECGNVWYFGEATTEYDKGKPVSTAGSWEAGVKGAQAGVIMPAKPTVGLQYRQEYFAGEAEDRANVFSLSEQAEVPYGHFTGVLLTRDSTPLTPKVLEYKFYARGIGPVLAVGISGGSDREELVSLTK